MSVNISDVAKAAGVSIATVSRIVNNLSGYSQATKDKVQTAIDELGYKPNAVARGLVSSKTDTIGVLLPCVTGRFSSELLKGIEKIAHSRGCSVIICNTDRNGERTMSYLRTLSEKRVDGILFISELLTEQYGSYLESLRIPVVLVATSSSIFPFSSVKVDDYSAAYSEAEYLISKGHRRIGFIAGNPQDPIAGAPRIEGYRAALNDAGIPFDPACEVYGDFHFESGIASMAILDTRSLGITAVCAASDEMALGAMTYLHRQKRRLPEQMSVIGYDDTLDAQMAYPSLTTVHQPIELMGQKAMELLSVKQPEHMILEHHICERESVLPLQG